MEQENISPVQEEPKVSSPVPYKIWGRILFGLFVTVIPVIAFFVVEVLQPDWQNGRFESYIALFLQPEASLLFFILLAYSVVCYLFLLAAPVHFSRFFPVRFGIYTGTLLALQYSITILVWSFFSNAYFIILIWISPLALIFLYRLAINKWNPENVNRSLLILMLAGLIIGAFWNGYDVFYFVLAGLIILSPFGSFLIALRASVWLFNNHETRFTLLHGLGVTAWLTSYVTAWRYDIIKTYELYAALPTQPPSDCYIATAAAYGHPQFVHSWTVQNYGKSMKVNRQLQILKFAELGLMAVNPRLHKMTRRFYDTVGKYAAGRIRNPFVADAAYFLLKPWEWCAVLMLGWIIPDIKLLSTRIYMNN